LARNASRRMPWILKTLRGSSLTVTDSTLVDAHVGQPNERGLVADRPADGLREPVDAGLVVVGDLGHGGSRLGEHVCGEGLLLSGDVSSHGALPQSVVTCERCSPGE
jgi:hypothetical protein